MIQQVESEINRDEQNNRWNERKERKCLGPPKFGDSNQLQPPGACGYNCSCKIHKLAFVSGICDQLNQLFSIIGTHKYSTSVCNKLPLMMIK